MFEGKKAGTLWEPTPSAGSTSAVIIIGPETGKQDAAKDLQKIFLPRAVQHP
jgi:hypothetical protein